MSKETIAGIATTQFDDSPNRSMRQLAHSVMNGLFIMLDEECFSFECERHNVRADLTQLHKDMVQLNKLRLEAKTALEKAGSGKFTW
jgi:hypothetical protein